MTNPTRSIDRSRHLVSRAAGMFLAGTCTVAFVFGTGCEYLVDKELNERKQAQIEFQKLANEYTILIGNVGSDNEPVAVAGKLDQLARRITSINGASSDQKKSAAALATAMNASAGSLRAYALETIGLDQAMLRERIAEGAASAMIVAAGAQIRTGANFSNTQQLIDQLRAGIDEQQSVLQNRILSMQTPLANMKEQHRDSTQQLNQLDTDVASLRQQANDAGPVDGYQFVEEAAGVRSRSIPIKSAIAEAEIQLSNLEPDIDRAQAERELLQAISDATDRAENNAMQLRDVVVAAGNAGKQRAASLVELVKSNLALYQEREESELKPLFEQAIANLQKATRPGQGRGASTMMAFNASLLAGDLWNQRADAASADAKLYTMLASTAPLLGGNPDQWSGLATEAQNEHAASIASARKEYESALERASTSGNNQAARDAVQQLLDSLDGGKIEQDPMDLALNSARPAPSSGGGGGGGLAAAMGTMGYDTPDELAAFLNGLSSRPPSPKLLTELIGACYTQNAQTIAQMNDPQAGAQMVQMMAGGLMGGAGGKIEVASVQGTQGELAPSNPPEGAPMVEIPIIRHQGKWYLDIDKLQERMFKMLEDAFNEPPGAGGNRGGGRGGGGFGNN